MLRSPTPTPTLSHGHREHPGPPGLYRLCRARASAGAGRSVSPDGSVGGLGGQRGPATDDTAPTRLPSRSTRPCCSGLWASSRCYPGSSRPRPRRPRLGAVAFARRPHHHIACTDRKPEISGRACDCKMLISGPRRGKRRGKKGNPKIRFYCGLAPWTRAWDNSEGC